LAGISETGKLPEGEALADGIKAFKDAFMGGEGKDG
jgi:hypothetical protein